MRFFFREKKKKKEAGCGIWERSGVRVRGSVRGSLAPGVTNYLVRRALKALEILGCVYRDSLDGRARVRCVCQASTARPTFV